MLVVTLVYYFCYIYIIKPSVSQKCTSNVSIKVIKFCIGSKIYLNVCMLKPATRHKDICVYHTPFVHFYLVRFI